MDPITVAVVAALAVLGNASLGEAAKRATGDAYNALKEKLRDKYGPEHSVPQLVETVESTGQRADSLQELDAHLVAFGASRDATIVEAARRVTSACELAGASHSFNVSGSFTGIGTNYGSSTMTIGDTVRTTRS